MTVKELKKRIANVSDDAIIVIFARDGYLEAERITIRQDLEKHERFFIILAGSII